MDIMVMWGLRDWPLAQQENGRMSAVNTHPADGKPDIEAHQ